MQDWTTIKTQVFTTSQSQKKNAKMVSQWELEENQRHAREIVQPLQSAVKRKDASGSSPLIGWKKGSPAGKHKFLSIPLKKYSPIIKVRAIKNNHFF